MPRIASACPRRTTSTTAGEPSAMSTVYPSDSASALTAGQRAGAAFRARQAARVVRAFAFPDVPQAMRQQQQPARRRHGGELVAPEFVVDRHHGKPQRGRSELKPADQIATPPSRSRRAGAACGGRARGGAGGRRADALALGVSAGTILMFTGEERLLLVAMSLMLDHLRIRLRNAAPFWPPIVARARIPSRAPGTPFQHTTIWRSKARSARVCPARPRGPARAGSRNRDRGRWPHPPSGHPASASSASALSSMLLGTSASPPQPPSGFCARSEPGQRRAALRRSRPGPGRARRPARARCRRAGSRRAAPAGFRTRAGPTRRRRAACGGDIPRRAAGRAAHSPRRLTPRHAEIARSACAVRSGALRSKGSRPQPRQNVGHPPSRF